MLSIALSIFPFHQGRFQGYTPEGMEYIASLISIPPRKVSRRRKYGARHLHTFHISIPPRKVSRSHIPKLVRFSS